MTARGVNKVLILLLMAFFPNETNFNHLYTLPADALQSVDQSDAAHGSTHHNVVLSAGALALI
jgi:hypothetical protein